MDQGKIERKRRYNIGKYLIETFADERLPATTVGKMLGLSRDRILQIERMAIYKVYLAMRKDKTS